jgi:hypothetical protein
MLPLNIDWYVTCLDLGPWGAVYTQGWDRQVASESRMHKLRDRRPGNWRRTERLRSR